ncbi:MAG: hypothetical protein CMP20_04435 [Rickettsiales bacterium]|nr:hypothetical protein [Rickettsiales bacterium]
MSSKCREGWTCFQVETEDKKVTKTVFVKQENVVEVVKTDKKAGWERTTKCVLRVLKGGEVVNFVPKDCSDFLRENVSKPLVLDRPDMPSMKVYVHGIENRCSIM